MTETKTISYPVDADLIACWLETIEELPYQWWEWTDVDLHADGWLEVRVEDPRSGEMTTMAISWHRWQMMLARLAEGRARGVPPQRWRDIVRRLIDPGAWDVNDIDIVLQLCCFGEVVYG